MKNLHIAGANTIIPAFTYVPTYIPIYILSGTSYKNGADIFTENKNKSTKNSDYNIEPRQKCSYLPRLLDVFDVSSAQDLITSSDAKGASAGTSRLSTGTFTKQF
jgi:hypothetical protein